MKGAAALLFALSIAGCATTGYDETRLRSQLENAGATPEQAACVTQGLTDEYAESQLGSHSAPTEAEYEFTRVLLARCKVNLALQPPP